MQLFYSNAIEGGTVMLGDDEARHLKVLRKQVGDEILVTDGYGNLHRTTLGGTAKKPLLTIVSTEKTEPLRPKIHLIVAPTKNLDRMEWMVEKCVEIGIHKFSFALCSRSERKVLKTDRLKRKAVSAMKQSKQYFLPEIEELQSFKDVLTHLSDATEKWVGHCEIDQEKTKLPANSSAEEIVLLIGPEGDFTPEEISLAKEAGFKAIDLGPTILRTETAAMVGVSLLRNR